MKNVFSSSITVKSICVLVAMALIPMFVVATINQQMSEQLRSEFFVQLETVSDDKQKRLAASIEQRMFEMDVLSHDLLFKSVLTDISGINIPELDVILEQHFRNYAERTAYIDTILEIEILDVDGNIRFSLYDTGFGNQYSVNDIQEISDYQLVFDHDEEFGRVVKATAPIYKTDLNQEKIGMLSFITDMRNFDPILLDRTSLKETGEAYFVNTDKIMASDSRFFENAAYNQIVDTHGVRECLENNSQVHGEIYDDYRGEPIIGYSNCFLEHGVVLLTEIDVKELTTSLDIYQSQFLWALSIVAGASFVVSLLIAKRIANPIKLLSKAADQISKENYDVNINVKGHDEIAQLTESMISMGQKLKNAQKEKEEFVAMITHDLKQPLVPISGNAELLNNPKMGELNDIQKECVEEILANATRQLSMIDNLVSAQKLGAGAMKYDLEELSSKDILNDCIKTHTPIMRGKNIEYFDSSTEDYTIKGDKRRILESFTNLIQNAHDFVPENGTIELGATDGNKEVTFFVKDNGEGIPKEKQNKLFKKYGQVESKAKREFGGTGLGLAVSQELVEGMNGKIWFESKVGQGTTLFFTVPKVVIEKEKTSFEKYEEGYVVRDKERRDKKEEGL